MRSFGQRAPGTFASGTLRLVLPNEPALDHPLGFNGSVPPERGTGGSLLVWLLISPWPPGRANRLPIPPPGTLAWSAWRRAFHGSRLIFAWTTFRGQLKWRRSRRQPP